MSPKETYLIRTVGDFLAVPPDRLDACLKEFAECVSLVRGCITVGELPNAAFDHFKWTDDGAPGVTSVNLNIEIEVPKPEAERV